MTAVGHRVYVSYIGSKQVDSFDAATGAFVRTAYTTTYVTDQIAAFQTAGDDYILGYVDGAKFTSVCQLVGRTCPLHVRTCLMEPFLCVARSSLTGSTIWARLPSASPTATRVRAVGRCKALLLTCNTLFATDFVGFRGQRFGTSRIRLVVS